MAPPAQQLRRLPGQWGLEHLPGERAVPDGDDWLALVRAPDGLTVIRPARPGDPPPGWVALFSGETAHGADVPGMLAALLVPLAAAGIAVVVASTYTADVVLVGADRLEAAAAALRAAGHAVALA